MEYRKLGHTDLLVSSVALGCWSFAGDANWGEQDDADSIATVATAASLEVLAQNPSLLNTRYPDLVADCAQRLARLVGSTRISPIQAADIMTVACRTILLNPVLFGNGRCRCRIRSSVRVGRFKNRMFLRKRASP